MINLHPINVAHAAARKAYVDRVKKSLTCGAHLLRVPADELPAVLRATGIDEVTATRYMTLAECATDWQRVQALRKDYLFGEAAAAELMDRYVPR